MAANDTELYMLKYFIKGKEYTHKGNLVRFSAFIMEMARNYLMMLQHEIVKVLGGNFRVIRYCDTDSIMVDLGIVDRDTADFVKDRMM